MAHRLPEGAAQLQRCQVGQHRRQDARRVPVLAVCLRHPQPQGNPGWADNYPHCEDERSHLGRGKAVAKEPPTGGGLDAGDDEGRPDHQPGGAEGSACITELDRGARRRGSGWPGRVAGGRAGLVHGDPWQS